MYRPCFSLYIHIWIFAEYASGGSLFDYLSTDESEVMDMMQVMTWAADIARGDAYIIYVL